MENKNLMTTGSVQKKIILFALPLLLGSIFQQLYNMVDSLIVGNFVGDNALAAVSSAGNLIFLIVGFFDGLSIGAGIVVARCIGARNKRDTQRAVNTPVVVGLVASVLMTVAGLLLAPEILRLMKTPEEVMPESVTYFRVYFAGATGLVMYNTFVSIIRASGDSRHPLYFLIFSSILNVILDLLFVAVLHMGVGGAALATAIGQICSALLALRALTRAEGDHRLVIREIRPDKAMAATIIRYGLPTGLQSSIISIGNLMIQSFINGFGAAAMAGIGVYSKLEGMAFIPVTAFSMAMTTFVSQNLGAGEQKRAGEGVRFGLTCLLILSETIGIALMFAAPFLISLFNGSADVIAYGVSRARVSGPFFFLVAFTHGMAAVVRGYGRPEIPTGVFLTCWCLVRVIVVTFGSRIYSGFDLVNWVYPFTWLLSSVSLLLFYLRIRRKEETA